MNVEFALSHHLLCVLYVDEQEPLLQTEFIQGTVLVAFRLPATNRNHFTVLGGAAATAESDFELALCIVLDQCPYGLTGEGSLNQSENHSLLLTAAPVHSVLEL